MANEEQRPRNRKPLLWGLTALILFISVVIFLLWLLIFRFQQSTNDAYVNGNQVVISPQISGFISSVTVEDTQLVEEGHVLVQLDTIDKTVAFERAKSELADTVRKVAELFQNVEKFKADTEARKAEMAKTGQDYEHRKKLVASGAISLEDFQHSEANFIAAFAGLLSAQYQLRGAEALTEGTTIATHPTVETGKTAVREAYVNLQRCTIRSPVTGMVASKNAQVGESIAPSTPLMTIIPLDQIWIDANFKESQLRHIRIGQSVKTTADMYGSDVVYHGHVIGIGAATGSVLSVLPPQNATGNWIKIVQRLPVRIGLESAEIKKNPLRLGLSMNVKVDIHDQKGKIIPSPTPLSALFSTDVFGKQIEGVEEIIDTIIRDNSTFSFEKVEATQD